MRLGQSYDSGSSMEKKFHLYTTYSLKIDSIYSLIYNFNINVCKCLYSSLQNLLKDTCQIQNNYFINLHM